MVFKDKVILLKNNVGFIFTIKGGKVIEKDNKCYQVPKWIAAIFKFYYFSGMVFFVLFGIVYLVPDFFDNFYIRFSIAITIYIWIETVLFFIVPINKRSCWQIY